MIALLFAIALLTPPPPGQPGAAQPGAVKPGAVKPDAVKPDAVKPGPVDIRADRLELDQKSGQARFEGSVEVVQGALTLRCARLQARYADGRIVGLEAEGDVRLSGEGWTAAANRAAWDRAAGRLVLTGDPRISRGGDTLRGARVLVWPDDERVVIEQARGRFTPPPLSGDR